MAGLILLFYLFMWRRLFWWLILDCKHLIALYAVSQQLYGSLRIKLLQMTIDLQKILITIFETCLNFPLTMHPSVLPIALIKRKNIRYKLNNLIRRRIFVSYLNSIMDKIFLVFLLKNLIVFLQEFIELLNVLLLLDLGGGFWDWWIWGHCGTEDKYIITYVCITIRNIS